MALLPPKPCDRGRHRRWRRREVLDEIFSILRAGCARRTAYHWFGELRDAGGCERLNHQLVQMDWAKDGRVQTDRPRSPMPAG